MENTGHGKMLSPSFVHWREELAGLVDPDELLARQVSQELEQEMEEMELERQRAALLAKLAAAGNG